MRLHPSRQRRVLQQALSSRRRGFTLLEVLIALAILAILSSMSYWGVSALVAAEGRLRDSSMRLRAVERLLAEFENDVLFAAPRATHGGAGEVEGALYAQREKRSEHGFRIGFSRFSHHPSQAPQRIGYRLAPPRIDILLAPLDPPANADDIAATTVLEGVQAASARFLDIDGRWSDTWPPAGGAATALPRAVELTLKLDGIGTITRLIARP